MASKAARFSISADDDRISILPDEIICHILSYLPTKYSVRTRILSTRWKYLFTLVPVLDFCCSLLCYSPDNIKPFVDFVNFVFSSYNVDRMDKFSYLAPAFLPKSEGYRLVSWIRESVNRGVLELSVTEIRCYPQMLPQNVFTSKTLVVLKLNVSFTIDVPDNVWLPCVQAIDLQGVTFLSDDSVRRLFQSCPVLEDLFLDDCNTENIEVIDICTPSLKRLKIHGVQDKYELVLDLPNVIFFEYLGYTSCGFFARDGLKSLINAKVSFPTESYAGLKALPKLVSMVSHVKSLELCVYTLESFRRRSRTFPTFHNLTNLELKAAANWNLDLGLLLCLLSRTPCLEVLVLENECFREYQPMHTVPEDVPMCVSTRLKVIEFRRFSLLVYEWTLVKYLLKNAKVLHTLYIQPAISIEKQVEMTRKLLSFSRCSRDCRVIFD